MLRVTGINKTSRTPLDKRGLYFEIESRWNLIIKSPFYKRGFEMDIKNISGKGYTCQTVCPKIAVFCIKNGQIHTSGFTLANCDYIEYPKNSQN